MISIYLRKCYTIVMDGIYLVNKPTSWSSNDALKKIKGLLKIKKLGHEGTLDPFASGLLIAFSGCSTKVIQFNQYNSKRYQATIRLGQKTNSGDLTGEVIEEKPIPPLTALDINKVLKEYIGLIKQVPPMFSAKKFEGRKLYELAREGKEIPRKDIVIEIFELKLLDFNNDSITIEALVSKGTYIRTLGEEIASKLGTVGHLTFLERTQIGRFSIKDALYPEEANKMVPITIAEYLGLPTLIADELQEKRIRNGQTLNLDIMQDRVFIQNKEGVALAIYQRTDNEFRILRGLW